MLLCCDSADENWGHCSAVSSRCRCICCACCTCLLLPAAMHTRHGVLASIASERLLLCMLHKAVIITWLHKERSGTDHPCNSLPMALQNQIPQAACGKQIQRYNPGSGALC